MALITERNIIFYKGKMEFFVLFRFHEKQKRKNKLEIN